MFYVTTTGSEEYQTFPLTVEGYRQAVNAPGDGGGIYALSDGGCDQCGDVPCTHQVNAFLEEHPEARTES